MYVDIIIKWILVLFYICQIIIIISLQPTCVYSIYNALVSNILINSAGGEYDLKLNSAISNLVFIINENSHKYNVMHYYIPTHIQYKQCT